VIVRRLPLCLPQPESIEWGRVVAVDRAVGEFEMLQIQQDRAPYSLYQFPAKSWADLVREFITIGGAA
jgi:hypothetical protein